MIIQKIVILGCLVGCVAGCASAGAATTTAHTTTSATAPQITTIAQGSGQYITPNDEIEMRFRSYLLDGTPLDGTMNNVPVILPVSQMFGGLQQALTQMQAGGKYSVHIPANVGFSEEGKAHKQAVNYEIEILRVNP